jgi:hypothetical protein
MGPAEGPADQRTVHLLSLSPGADQAMGEFERWLEPQLGQSGRLGNISDWSGKVAGAIARIAGLLHLATLAAQPEQWALCIGEDTMRSAITLGRYFIAHALVTFGEMGADPKLEMARHLLSWIGRQRRSCLTRRELFEGTKGRFREVVAMDPAIAVLLDHGFIRQRPSPPRDGPGRPPSSVYEVNPLWLSQNAQNSQRRDPVGGGNEMRG